MKDFMKRTYWMDENNFNPPPGVLVRCWLWNDSDRPIPAYQPDDRALTQEEINILQRYYRKKLKNE